VLITQIYFPDEPHNHIDGIFKPTLLMQVQDSNDAKTATFNFVLDEQLRKNRTGSRKG
jgi:hypothetical protein